VNRLGRNVIDDGDTAMLIAAKLDVTVEALTRGQGLGR
jgi:hypothetical protein